MSMSRVDGAAWEMGDEPANAEASHFSSIHMILIPTPSVCEVFREVTVARTKKLHVESF